VPLRYSPSVGSALREKSHRGFSPASAPWVVVTRQGATYYKQRDESPAPPPSEEFRIQDPLI